MCYECFVLVILNSNWIFTKSLNYLCGRKASACLFDFVIGLFLLGYFSLAQKFLYKTLPLMCGVPYFCKICEWQKNPLEAGWRGTTVGPVDLQFWALAVTARDSGVQPLQAWAQAPGHTTATCAPVLGAVASCCTSAQLSPASSQLCLHLPCRSRPCPHGPVQPSKGCVWPLPPSLGLILSLPQEHPDPLLSRRDCSEQPSASGSTKQQCRV